MLEIFMERRGGCGLAGSLRGLIGGSEGYLVILGGYLGGGVSQGCRTGLVGVPANTQGGRRAGSPEVL